ECLARSMAFKPHALGVPVVGLFGAHGIDSGDEGPNASMLGNGLCREQNQRQADPFGFAEANRCLTSERQHAWLMSCLTDRDKQRINHTSSLGGRGCTDRRSDGAPVLAVAFFKRYSEGFASTRPYHESEPSDSFHEREMGCGADPLDRAHLVTSAVMVVLFIPRFLMTV